MKHIIDQMVEQKNALFTEAENKFAEAKRFEDAINVLQSTHSMKSDNKADSTTATPQRKYSQRYVNPRSPINAPNGKKTDVITQAVKDFLNKNGATDARKIAIALEKEGVIKRGQGGRINLGAYIRPNVFIKDAQRRWHII